MSGRSHPSREATHEVMLCADGPMLVRGPVDVEDEQGVVHHSDRPVVAICRCGATGSAPWCDGSHKALVRRAVPSPRRSPEGQGRRTGGTDLSAY